MVTRHGGSSELKWTKIKKHNTRLYNEAIDGYFKAVRKGYLKYYCIVVDMSDRFRRHYNEGDSEIGFNKLLFTLLFKFVRLYRPYKVFEVYLDHRTTRHKPDDLRAMLNARAAREYNADYAPFRRLQFRHSETSRIIQMTDVVSGAIAYATNKHAARIAAADYKVAMAEHVARCAGVPSLAIPTPFSDRGFDIWHLVPDPRKRVLRP